MELRALLLLPLCFPGRQAQIPDAEERQPEGSTLNIDCPYTAQTHYEEKKAWCRMRDDECEPLVETTGGSTPYPYTKEATNGKITIVDKGYIKRVTITMTNLQAEDSGTYSCAYLYYSTRYIALRTISLTVFKELDRWESESLSVQCPYGTLGHSIGTKYWCRRQGQSECKEVVRTDGPTTWNKSQALEGRTSIQDDTQTRTLTITMRNLQAQDSGVYQCAFYRDSRPTLIMEFKLSVSNISARTTLSGTASPSQATPPGNSPPPRSPTTSTERTITTEEEIKQDGCQTLLWLVLAIMTSKILATVILVLLTRSRMRNCTQKASR